MDSKGLAPNYQPSLDACAANAGNSSRGELVISGLAWLRFTSGGSERDDLVAGLSEELCESSTLTPNNREATSKHLFSERPFVPGHHLPNPRAVNRQPHRHMGIKNS